MVREYPISKFRKINKPAEATAPNEVRVRVDSRPFSYAAYAAKQLLEKKSDMVHINATGAAVSNAIKVIEYLKKSLKGLHVQYKIQSKKFIDEYEPTIEGLDKVTTERIVSTLECILTLTKGDQLKGTPGYIEPLPEAQVNQAKFEESLKKYQERKDERAHDDDGERGDRRPRGGDRDFGGDRRPRDDRDDRDRRPRDDRDGGDRRPRGGDREGGDRRPRGDGPRTGGDRDGGDRPRRGGNPRPTGGDKY